MTGRPGDGSGSTRAVRKSVRRPPCGRTLLVTLAVVGSLVAGEVFLQAAAWAMRSWVEQRGGTVAAEGSIRILCVGDSHTFGLPLPEEESYPAQLAEALAARHPDFDVEVVNLGIPSLNSAFVANRLEQQIHQIQPQLVIVWVGINNLWNVVERGPFSRGDSAWSVRQKLHASRLFRLVSMLWFSFTGHKYDPASRGGWWPGEATPSGRLPTGAPKSNPAPGLLRDLSRIASVGRALDVPILFVAYPFSGQQSISRIIVQAAARAGVGVVDTRRAMERARGDGYARADLIDERAGLHPSGVLYGYVVQAMLPEVESLLSAWHGLPPAVHEAPESTPVED